MVRNVVLWMLRTSAECRNSEKTVLIVLGGSLTVTKYKTINWKQSFKSNVQISKFGFYELVGIYELLSCVLLKFICNESNQSIFVMVMQSYPENYRKRNRNEGKLTLAGLTCAWRLDNVNIVHGINYEFDF